MNVASHTAGAFNKTFPQTNPGPHIFNSQIIQNLNLPFLPCAFALVLVGSCLFVCFFLSFFLSLFVSLLFRLLVRWFVRLFVFFD